MTTDDRDNYPPNPLDDLAEAIAWIEESPLSREARRHSFPSARARDAHALRTVIAAARATDQRIAEAVRAERERWAGVADDRSNDAAAKAEAAVAKAPPMALGYAAESSALADLAADMRANKETT